MKNKIEEKRGASEAAVALLPEQERVTLCEVLDRLLNKGVVISGEVAISVADIDLIYVRLQLLITSIEQALSSKRA